MSPASPPPGRSSGSGEPRRLRPPAPWLDRHFPGDLEPGLLPVLSERLRGAVPRGAELLRSVSAADAGRRTGQGWSLLDHLGHLADLDRGLFLPRLRAFEHKQDELPAADLENAATRAAEHHRRNPAEVQERFRQTRTAVLARVESMDEATLQHRALHPRLKTPMRVVDLMAFFAEHDDHHLAWMRWLRSGQ